MGRRLNKRIPFVPDSRLLYTHDHEVGDDADIRLAYVGHDIVINGASISFHQCMLKRPAIISGIGMQVAQSRLETVDAANADLEQSGWRKVEIVGSRFTGARLNSAHLTECIFEECRMNLVQCQLSTLRGVRFERCDLRGAFFNSSELPGTVFEGSDLSSADFSGANIAGCDFRRAIIEEIRVAPDQMNGLIVTSDQALYLARLFGLDIQE